MFNFYLLPEELQEYINYLVLQKHQCETKSSFKNVLKEMECLWYWVIYGSSLIYKNIQQVGVGYAGHAQETSCYLHSTCCGGLPVWATDTTSHSWREWVCCSREN